MAKYVKVKVYFKFNNEVHSEATIKFQKEAWDKLSENLQKHVVRATFFDSYEWAYTVEGEIDE